MLKMDLQVSALAKTKDPKLRALRAVESVTRGLVGIPLILTSRQLPFDGLSLRHWSSKRNMWEDIEDGEVEKHRRQRWRNSHKAVRPMQLPGQ